ncbi:MAG: translation initiation factor IF-2 [Firmicutes bacterium]|nr:translation initiation factor IF-2 [Bacillota bacterium]
MQQNSAKQASGKLDNIKTITEHLPHVSELLSQCRESRSKLESLLSHLKGASAQITSSREEAKRRAEKEAQFADLIKQREEERRIAEEKVDRKAEELKAKKEEKAAAIKKEPAKPQPQQTPVSQPQPQVQESRPQTREFTPNRQFQPRTDFQPRPAQNRTWTPQQSSGAYGRGLAREGGQMRPGGAPFQRPGGAPFGQRPGGPGQRPFTPRPSGAGGAAGAAKPPTERFVPKTDTHATKSKKTKFDGEKSSGMDRRSLLRRGIIEEQDIEERMLTRLFRTKKSKENSDKASTKQDSNIIKITTNTITVKSLSEKIGKTATEIIKQLMVLGEMCTINSSIDFSTAELVSAEFGFQLELHADKTYEEQMSDRHKGAEDEKELVARPPVITVMGHVDHGKTTLLDNLRKARVAASECGGITQHIGAYQVSLKGKKITFIDTPGHAAFDKMRARGAKITDIAILIVAGDDGVMPQTVEAIKHIQGQNLPMIVAVNKMDKKEFDIERVKTQLSEHNVVPEEWGGNAIIVPVSAQAGTNLDKLLEMILLVADMNGYKANPNKEASGSILEAKLDKTRGPVVTVLVQSGTLKVGDTLLAGTTYGKVRAMTDEAGKEVRKARPSTPVQVLGFSDVPKAGDAAYVVDEKLTKQVVAERRDKEKVKKTKCFSTTEADNAFDAMTEAEKTPLNLIIKGDVAGSLEAIIQTINTITSDEVAIHVVSSGVGAVNDNDVSLADVTGARLIAFSTKTTQTAKQIAKKQKVQIHEFDVIYQIFDFVTNEMVKLFKPKYVDKYHGRAEVLQVFRSSAVGLISGCRVTDGKILRNTRIRLVRGGEQIGEYKLESLKIKSNDTKEVAINHECGIKLEGNVLTQVGDILECYGQEQLPIMYNGRKYEF